MVEVDESYVGGREINKHYPKKRSDINPELRNDGTPFKDKKVVIGITERDGKVVLKHVSGASKQNMVSFIKKHVPEGSKIYTDEYHGYTGLGRWYTYGTVKHALHVYVAGDVNTNSIENFWSILKRGLYGIYHQVSEKHLERYLDEFSARFNTRKISEQERFENFLNQSESPLSYKRLGLNSDKPVL